MITNSVMCLLPPLAGLCLELFRAAAATEKRTGTSARAATGSLKTFGEGIITGDDYGVALSPDEKTVYFRTAHRGASLRAHLRGRRTGIGARRNSPSSPVNSSTSSLSARPTARSSSSPRSVQSRARRRTGKPTCGSSRKRRKVGARPNISASRSTQAATTTTFGDRRRHALPRLGARRRARRGRSLPRAARSLTCSLASALFVIAAPGQI